jgi:hypothetical protein
MQTHAPQFDLPGQESIFNLAGETIIQQSPAPQTAANPTPELALGIKPRGRHVHKCQYCGERCNCYKAHCSKPYLVDRVPFCQCR